VSTPIDFFTFGESYIIDGLCDLLKDLNCEIEIKTEYIWDYRAIKVFVECDHFHIEFLIKDEFFHGGKVGKVDLILKIVTYNALKFISAHRFLCLVGTAELIFESESKKMEETFPELVKLAEIIKNA